MAPAYVSRFRQTARSEECSHEISASLQDPLIGVAKRLEQFQQAYPNLVPLLTGQPLDHPDQACECRFRFFSDHLDVGGCQLAVQIILGIWGREGGLRIKQRHTCEQSRLCLADLGLCVVGVGLEQLVELLTCGSEVS